MTDAVRQALEWYAAEAEALAKNTATGAHTQAVLASVTVLALDGGRKARAALSEQPTRSQKLADAGYARRPGLWAMQAREALELIAAPQRPDGSWNRDREACRQITAEALGRYDDEPATPRAVIAEYERANGISKGEQA